MEEKEVDESFFKLIKEAFRRYKEPVNWYFLVMSYILSSISSALEAISLGLIVPLFERVINENKTSDIGIVQKVLDYFSITKTSDIIIAVAIMIFVAVVLKNVLGYVAGWLHRIVNANIGNFLTKRIMKEFVTRDMLFFERKKIGEITYSMGLSGTFPGLIDSFFDMSHKAFFCIAYAVVLFYLSPKICLFIVLSFLPMYLVSKWVKKMIVEMSKKMIEIGQNFNIRKLEILSSIRLIKTYASEKEELKRFNQLSDQSKNLGIKMGNVGGLLGLLNEPIMTLGLMLLAGISFFYFIDSTKGGIAGFMTFFVILRRFEWEMRSFITSVAMFPTQKPYLKKFLDSTRREGWMTIKSGDKKFTGLKKSIEFKHLYFGYDDHADYILKDINLKIEKGKMTALVGESGSGKTTIAMLIPYLFEYHKGKILVDGVEIKKYDTSSLRKKMGIVSQDVEILSRSVKDNICFGIDREVSEEKLVKIAKKAKIYNFIESLPNKFDTLLGERGTNLSGGQKQRISIARAIIKNPDILILDEATSALDTETEREIQKSIETIIKGKTVLAIAHRLSTIEHADKIVVIEEGRMVEQGTFKQLLRKKGKFYNYWKIQTEVE